MNHHRVPNTVHNTVHNTVLTAGVLFAAVLCATGCGPKVSPPYCYYIVGPGQTLNVTASPDGTNNYQLDDQPVSPYNGLICAQGVDGAPAVVNLVSCHYGVDVVAEQYSLVNGGGPGCEVEACPGASLNISQPGTNEIWLDAQFPEFALCECPGSPSCGQ